MKVREESSLCFVYPFVFKGSTFKALASAVDVAACQTAKESMLLWERRRVPLDDLLKAVADFLNPQPLEGEDGQRRMPSALLWRIRGNALQSPSVLGAGGKTPWNVQMPHKVDGKPLELPFLLENLDLMLFPVGVGMLVLRVRPTSQDYPDWQNFIHYFRFIHRRCVGIRVERRVGFDKGKRQPIIESYLPGLLGGTDKQPDGIFVMQDVLSALLNQVAPSKASSGWWDDVFIPGQLFPFASLFLEGLSDSKQPERDMGQVLYVTRNSFHTNQGQNPCPDDLRLDHESLLTYAERQWFLFSLDGGAFVAFDPPDTEFFRATMPAHLGDQYLLLLLLVLHQRFALMYLSRQVAERWIAGDDDRIGRQELFDEIRDALLNFTARGYFTQVMQREHHHRCYRRWQEAFQVTQLYAEVDGEVSKMYEYLQMKKAERLSEDTERVQGTLGLLGAVFGVPALVVGVFGMNIVGVTSGGPALSWAQVGGIVGGSFAVGGLLLALVARRRRKRLQK